MVPRANRLVGGAMLGVLPAGFAIAVGELCAAFVGPGASPIIVVGNKVILLTPEPVRRWAIRAFGVQDKHVLLAGIYAVLTVAALVIGVLALRLLWFGVLGIVALDGFGVFAALDVPARDVLDVLPVLVGGVVAVGVLSWLARLWNAMPESATSAAPDPVDRTAPSSRTSRRTFVQASTATAGLATAGILGGRAWQRSRYSVSAARAAVVLPAATGPVIASGRGYDFGKSGLPFVTPNADFYQIDTQLITPQINPHTWKLRIHGMVKREMTISYAELLARPQVERLISLACVSNEIGGRLVGTAKFQGVLLAELLREVGVADEADQLLSTSRQGMTIGSPTKVLLDGRDAMLAVGMNGVPLPPEHGFPVRMVVPGLYGYVSACKWIVDIKATTFAEKAFWVQGGWTQLGPVKLASRIDTPQGGPVGPIGGVLAIAGVAWDQHVGISAVQVQIDEGVWNRAQLAAVPSTDTWRQWVYLWTVPDADPHTIRVRAFDARGRPQVAKATIPYPSGVTGLHTITVYGR
ncbi:MAG: molybdopterin-binding oxidoreductase [Frankiales bacterium]|nr:molybdopterin-binding oxidoreductase [Frankiales bacterium]